jgi:hypothetical protein
VTHPAAAFILAVLLPVAAQAQSACPGVGEGARSVESARYGITWRTEPLRITVGKPFAVDFVLCPKNGETKVEELRVDAHMPEHRHGMNYKASVKPQGGAGHYRAEGLMLHMPGKWEFLFDVRDAKGVERLKQDYPLK